MVRQQQSIDVQSSFLSQAWDTRTPLTLFLMNGVQMKGILKGFDNFTIEIESGGKQQIIYKHAISTIVPNKLLKLRLAAQ